MPRCKTHPDRESLAECSTCGASFCEECLVAGAHPALCLDCSIAAAGQLVGRQARISHAQEAVAPWKRARRLTWIRAVAICGLILVAGEAATIFLLRPAATDTRGATTTGRRRGERARTVMDTANLLLIRSRLEDEYLRTGTLPESLLELELPPAIEEQVTDGQIQYREADGENFTLSSAASPVPVEGGRSAIAKQESRP